MPVSISRSRITKFSLPADSSASSILRRFIRDIAQETTLSEEEVTELQMAVTNAFNTALMEQKCAGEGRIALKIDACPDSINVDLTYRETHFPPAEFFYKS